jgi:uncharacterized protein (UPF0335 family)
VFRSCFVRVSTAIVERIERVDGEIKGLRDDDHKDIYAEAKGNGYDPKVLRKVVALRKMDPDARAEQDSLLETYMQALGML